MATELETHIALLEAQLAELKAIVNGASSNPAAALSNTNSAVGNEKEVAALKLEK
ncbi:hypothetical protein HK100_005327 [Physocladia obscura]|uniref:Uncharacterized protein n=1 Tax=Physocladia obscura TaxID=109957 RepID=A0AAD5TC71_9FUNG|nr:hypothetical protein HK100_005327 [Physocladia obscura]